MKYIVSDEHKFIYFVVQKVACTSIKTALLPLFDVDTTGYETTRKDGTTGLRIHKLFALSDYEINEQRLLKGMDDEYQEYFKFAFVRNPWDRVVSCYCNKLNPNGDGLHLPAGNDIKLYKGMPFAEFVEAVHAIPDSKANKHFQSQHQVICGPGSDRPILADFVGRFENLAADFDVVAKRIGGMQKLYLPHILRSRTRQSRSYTEFYDDRLRKLVHERFQEDIEIFGYSFGDPRNLQPLRVQGDRSRSWRSDEDDADRLRKQNRNLKRHAEKVKERNRILKKRHQDLKRDAETLREQNRILKERNQRMKRQLQDMRSSKGWRLLQSISRFKKRLLRSPAR